MENNPQAPSTQDQYVQAIKNSFISLGKKAVMAKLIQLSSVFALGPINALTALVVEKILTIVVNETETGIYFLYIDMRVHGQGREFSQAAQANFKAQQNGTKEEKDAAEKALIDAFSKLVKFTM
jgi:hypothetical protein